MKSALVKYAIDGKQGKNLCAVRAGGARGDEASFGAAFAIEEAETKATGGAFGLGKRCRLDQGRGSAGGGRDDRFVPGVPRDGACGAERERTGAVVLFGGIVAGTRRDRDVCEVGGEAEGGQEDFGAAVEWEAVTNCSL